MNLSTAPEGTELSGKRLGERWDALVGHRAFPLLLVSLIYAVLAIIVTYPVILHFGEAIAGMHGDSFQHLWTLWWGERALFDAQTALTDVSMLYHPQQLEHPIMGITPLIQIVAAPFVALFGPIATYNLWHLLSTILAGATTYLLAYEVSRNHGAAFVGGLIFAFAPSRMIHGIGHYAQIMTYLFPLYFLFLIRLLKRASWKDAVLAGVVLALSLLVNFVHIAYFLVPGTVILVLVYAVVEGRAFWQKERILYLSLTAGLALLLTSPRFVPFILSAGTGGLGYLQSEGVSLYGADLLAFVTPSPLHPLLDVFPSVRQAFHHIVANGYTHQNVTEGIVYLGIAPLLLAIWAVRKQYRTARPWLILLLVSAVLSLGPLLRVNGEFLTYEVDDVVSYFIMPYAALTKLPLFELARTPGRLNGLTMMALAVLVSLGIASLPQRWRSAKMALVAPGLVAAVVALEYIAIWPYPVATVQVPQFYTDLASEPGQSAILDHPMYLIGYQSAHSFDTPMYYQLFHERPIAGGYVWRLPPEADGTMRALDNLVSPQPRPDITPVIPMEERAALLRELGFGHVVIHKFDTQTGIWPPMPEEQLAATVDHMTTLFGPPVFEDEAIIAFRVPGETGDTGYDGLFLTPGANWLESEMHEDFVWRWSTGQQSSFIVYGLDASSSRRLAFRAASIEGPKQATLSVNGEVLGDMLIAQDREFVTPPFTLDETQNTITLTVREPCRARDPQQSLSRENPCLNIQVSGARLIAADEPAGAHAVRCRLGDQIELLSYDLEPATPKAGDTLRVTLYWRATAPVTEAYTVFTHLRDEGGTIYAQGDGQPLEGIAPTSSWMPGEIIVDDHVLTLPEDLPELEPLWLTTGLYLWPSGVRLAVDPSCPMGSPEAHITLETFEELER